MIVQGKPIRKTYGGQSTDDGPQSTTLWILLFLPYSCLEDEYRKIDVAKIWTKMIDV